MKINKKVKRKTSEVKAHSEFGGSQAKRIKECPASVRACRGIPNKTNPAAERGTHAHACLEFIVNNRTKLKDKKERKKILKIAENHADWDEHMVECALDALTYIQSKRAPKGKIFVEMKVDSTKFTTGDVKNPQSSTLDLLIANYSARTLWVIDYKFGKHPVEVKKNDQILYYAVAALIKLNGWDDFDTIICGIIQPNAYHKLGCEREWVVSVDDAVKWARKFKKKVKIALKPNAPYKYGDWCFFCLANSKCPVIAERKLNKEFEDYSTKGK